MRPWKRTFERDITCYGDPPKRSLLTVRVKKQHLRDCFTREEIIKQACREATGLSNISLCTDDMDELGTVAVCKSDKKAKRQGQLELLLPKAAHCFLKGGVNTFKPFRFRAIRGCFS